MNVNMSMNPNTLLLLGMSPDKIKKLHSNVVIQQPNYSVQSSDYFPSKTKPTMSEKEYEEAIKEQARKDALAGVGRLENNASMALKREYVSIASPDRKGIIASAMQKVSYSSTSKTQVVTYASFADSAGREVATYSSNYGWKAIGTPEEGARARQFNSIYWKSYQEALDEMGGGLNIRA